VWIWSRRIDLSVFGGSAAMALLIAALWPQLSIAGALPPWAWIVFVLALDVAHVWSTIFRTYLDREEVARRRVLYLGLPVICYLGGVALHMSSSLTFWRFVAYVAVFHFIRQQVGWVAIYRAKENIRGSIDRYVDAGVIYAATGWPLLWWHTHLPRKFQWMVPGDFIDLSALAAAVTPLGFVYVALVVAYVARSVSHWRRGARQWGKHLVVVTTGAVWYVGIVAMDEDFAFTITNVTIHAVPYFALLWAYARQRAPECPGSFMSRIVGYGVGAFFMVALAFAFCEEMLWDRLIWHEHGYLFGGSLHAPELSSTWLTLLVPLLALPQLVHYALDGVLWRSKDAGAAQARALGFAR
jgi:hypothetical protein